MSIVNKKMSIVNKTLISGGSWMLKKAGIEDGPNVHFYTHEKKEQKKSALSFFMSPRFIIPCLLSISSFYFSLILESEHHIVSNILHELGMALSIAIVVWLFFEWSMSRSNEEEWNDRIERVTKSVFFGVFRRRLPEMLINEASTLVLEQSLIRTGLEVTYTLTDEKYTLPNGVLSDFVILNTTTRFKIINVSNKLEKYKFNLSLPDPIHDKLREKVTVSRVAWRRNLHWSEVDITKSLEKFKETLLSNDKPRVTFEGGEIPILANETIHICLSYSMAKEPEDSEILETLFPCDGISVSVTDMSPSKRTIRARAIHPGELDNTSSREDLGQYTYRLDRFLLPHQGVLLWWKRRPNSGSVST